MPILVWDKPKDRTYETGLDRGVLYLPDGSAVPWNGLTSVVENSEKEVSPIYYDGMKINDLVSPGDFSGTIKAITYPDEFVELEGAVELRPGLFANEQSPKVFGLSYRTQFGDGIDGDTKGYKIHLLYNITAIPSEKTYASQGDSPSLVEFEWSITATPEDFPGIRPTAHIIINSLDFDPWLIEELEGMLYGDAGTVPGLIPLPALITFLVEWYRVKIIDNGDGTWTAVSQRDGFIYMLPDDQFQIVHINARYLNETTFILSDTMDISDVPQIIVIDNGDGTWTVTTVDDNLIIINPDGSFEIRNINAEFIGSDSYQILDTAETI